MSKFPMANKSFGQHFLNSPNVIKKITSPLPEGTEAIVEIGPGPAVLTPHLASYGLPVHVIEMDARFVELLEPIVGSAHVYRQDALEFNWNNFLSNFHYKNIWLVSNLPYNVSVPLTLSFLRIPQIMNMTLMYQKEVADKILPRDPRNSMGSLHMMAISQFHLSHVVHAPPGAFVPPPKVDSQVLNFSRRNFPLVPLDQIDLFEKFLRIIFSNRRKQLGGILKKELGEARAKIILEDSHTQGEIRSEALQLEKVLKLYEIFHRTSSPL